MGIIEFKTQGNHTIKTTLVEGDVKTSSLKSIMNFTNKLNHNINDTFFFLFVMHLFLFQTGVFQKRK